MRETQDRCPSRRRTLLVPVGLERSARELRGVSSASPRMDDRSWPPPSVPRPCPAPVSRARSRRFSLPRSVTYDQGSWSAQTRDCSDGHRARPRSTEAPPTPGCAGVRRRIRRQVIADEDPGEITVQAPGSTCHRTGRGHRTGWSPGGEPLRPGRARRAGRSGRSAPRRVPGARRTDPRSGRLQRRPGRPPGRREWPPSRRPA